MAKSFVHKPFYVKDIVELSGSDKVGYRLMVHGVDLYDFYDEYKRISGKQRFYLDGASSMPPLGFRVCCHGLEDAKAKKAFIESVIE